MIIITLLFVLLAIGVSAASPFKYGSSTKLLTIISFNDSVDPYVASKSNEYLSNVLSQIVTSGSFFEKIKESGFNIDKNYFSGSDKKQIKKWNKTARAKSETGSGIIDIDVYHTDRDQAEQIARAVAYTLQTDHMQYHGYGKNVEIKVIDKPITSTFPVQPNLALNLGLGLFFGLIFSLSYIYLFPVSAPIKKERFSDHVPAAAGNYQAGQEEAQEYASKLANSSRLAESQADFSSLGDMQNILRK